MFILLLLYRIFIFMLLYLFPPPSIQLKLMGMWLGYAFKEHIDYVLLTFDS